MKSVLFLTTLLLFIFPRPSDAVPRFASRMNLQCQSCHVNPTGGGMRNLFAAKGYGREELPVPEWRDKLALEDFTPQISPFLSFGADFRMLYFVQQDPVSTRSSFLLMQSDLYLRASLSKKTTLYVSKGLTDRFEAFGLAEILPMKGYLKVGWFSPAFGIRMDDHNILTREKTLFPFNRGNDAGLEVGFNPGSLLLLGSITNGSNASRDFDSFKALLGRVEVRSSWNNIRYWLGGSYYNNATLDGSISLFGAFSMITLGENLTLLSEVDWRREYSNTSRKRKTSLIAFFEIDYVLTQGIDLKVGYDFFDPDIDLTTGSQSRFVFGFEFFPLSGIELRPQYIIKRESPSEVRNDQFVFLVHFFF